MYHYKKETYISISIFLYLSNCERSALASVSYLAWLPFRNREMDYNIYLCKNFDIILIMQVPRMNLDTNICLIGE